MVGMQEGCMVVGFLQKDFLKQMGFLLDDCLLSPLVVFTPDFLLVPKKTPTYHWNLCSQLFVKEKLSYDQEFQVRKMEVLSLRLFFWGGGPLHKPYPYS